MQVPVLQTPEGGIWESNAIARYVARLSDKGLFGATAYDAVSAQSLCVCCAFLPILPKPSIRPCSYCARIPCA